MSLDKPTSNGANYAGYIWIALCVIPIIYGLCSQRLLRADVVFAICAIFLGTCYTWKSYRAERQSGLMVMARTYLCSTLLFGGLHYGIYISSPTSYSFSASIMPFADEEKLRSTYAEIRTAYRRVGLLAELRSWVMQQTDNNIISAKLANKTRKTWELPSGVVVKHSYRPGGTTYGDIWASSELTITDRYGTETWGRTLFEQSLLGLNGLIAAEASGDYLSHIRRIEEISHEHIKDLSKTLLGKRHPFNVLDFVYFSIVTVTTLGYGDIVPNRTIVRVLVVAQIFFGLFLLQRAFRHGILPRLDSDPSAGEQNKRLHSDGLKGRR